MGIATYSKMPSQLAVVDDVINEHDRFVNTVTKWVYVMHATVIAIVIGANYLAKTMYVCSNGTVVASDIAACVPVAGNYTPATIDPGRPAYSLFIVAVSVGSLWFVVSIPIAMKEVANARARMRDVVTRIVSSRAAA